MLMNKAVQLAVLTAAAMLWQTRTDAAPSAFKLCGRKLSEIMSRVCHVYNSPSWDVPTVVEQPTAAVRRKRQVGIADECCTYGCTWEQLSEYCSITSESLLDGLETHMIADRSAEKESEPSVIASPAAIGSENGAGATRGGKRRENLTKNAARAAPVVGTVSPLLTWGRTLNTDLPSGERDRYAYVSVYTT